MFSGTICTGASSYYLDTSGKRIFMNFEIEVDVGFFIDDL